MPSSTGSRQLYDLSADPGEQQNLAGDRNWEGEEERLQTLLDVYVQHAGGAPPLPDAAHHSARSAFGELDAESTQRLQELGYLGE